LLKNNSTKHFSKWESVKHGVTQGLIFGPLFFLLYINDLPQIISDMSKLILFSDDMSKIVTNSAPYEFKKILPMSSLKLKIGLKVIYFH
jgi:hypothetical protein